MQHASSWILGLGLLGLVLPGCGTFSVPRVAANGTTIMIPVPDGFGSGFGRALNQNLAGPTDPGTIFIPDPDPDSPLEDFQRGELLFALHAGSSPESTLVTYLPVRYITRVHLDEGSSAALPAPGESYISGGTNPQTGQVVALVDVPRDVDPDTYYIFMERWRRNDPPNDDNFVQLPPPQIGSPPLPWLSWAGFAGATPSPDAPMEIQIVESSVTGSLFNDAVWGFDKWFGNYGWRNFTADLDSLIPRPKLRIWIENPSPPPGTPKRPAAWEYTIQYTSGKIEILGAELGALHRSGGIVSVSPATGSPASCSSTSTATISLVDPDQGSIWVDLVYRLRDFDDCGRAGSADFAEVSVKAYKVDGSAIAAPYAYIDFYSSFP